MAKKVSHSGILDLGGFKIPCYVLEDGTRVLSSSKMQESLKMIDKDDPAPSGTRLARYLGQKSLKPFIHKDKEGGHFDPIVSYVGGSKINGYEATVLVDICDAFLEARKHIDLSSRQKIIADQCEILVRSFARVGIIALVDEATGYQKEKDEYQKRLGMYIAEEMRPWIKTFQEDYYQNIYKLMGWDWSLFTSGQYKNHPQIVGKITNDIVYKKLPVGVLKELDKLNPKDEKGRRKNRHHQFLSESHGFRELISHLGKISVIAQMYGFGDYKKAKAHLDSILPDQREGSQMTLGIPVSIDEYIGNKEPKLSGFNKKLKKGLEFDPRIEVR